MMTKPTNKIKLLIIWVEIYYFLRGAIRLGAGINTQCTEIHPFKVLYHRQLHFQQCTNNSQLSAQLAGNLLEKSGAPPLRNKVKDPEEGTN